MGIKHIYLLYYHEKGIDFASGYGTEYIKGFALTEVEAKTWVKGLKETGFERRLYKKQLRRARNIV